MKKIVIGGFVVCVGWYILYMFGGYVFLHLGLGELHNLIRVMVISWFGEWGMEHPTQRSVLIVIMSILGVILCSGGLWKAKKVIG